MSIQKLLEAITKMEVDDAVKPAEYLTDGCAGDLPKTVDEVEGLACEALITNQGQCNGEALAAMRAAGYPVRAGEQDSFGWLTGLFRTSKGWIVYG